MYKIGISACFMYPDPARAVFAPKTLSYLENDMARYISQEGVLPVLIPDLDDDRLLPIIEEMDGFVFQGGTDLAPQSYGEAPIGRWKGDPIRDAYDLKLFDLAVKANKPILAICRGLQLMNVYFGGTLYQDTDTQLEQVLTHRDADTYDFLYHNVSFTPGKVLEKIYHNSSVYQVNSVHHQSIKDLGSNLEILAKCPEDGIIEAIGHTNNPEGFIVGVQWHPEFSETLKDTIIAADPLFNMFLNHVKSLNSAENASN